MTTKRDVNNPWNSKPSSGNPANAKSNKGSANTKPKTKQADQKFKEAKQKHEEYAKKHNILEYDSSSDEELETGSMLGMCVQIVCVIRLLNKPSVFVLQNPYSRTMPEIMQSFSEPRTF